MLKNRPENPDGFLLLIFDDSFFFPQSIIHFVENEGKTDALPSFFLAYCVDTEIKESAAHSPNGREW